MLQLACRVGLCVNIGNFLELERTLHGDWILNTAAEEEGVLFWNEELRQGFNLRIQQWRSKSFGGGNANFNTRSGQKNQVTLSNKRAVIHIRDNQTTNKLILTDISQCGQTVRSFTRLGNCHQ